MFIENANAVLTYHNSFQGFLDVPKDSVDTKPRFDELFKPVHHTMEACVTKGYVISSIHTMQVPIILPSTLAPYFFLS